jgi:hypothetical protein
MACPLCRRKGRTSHVTCAALYRVALKAALSARDRCDRNQYVEPALPVLDQLYHRQAAGPST